jgi:hypothetical protein
LGCPGDWQPDCLRSWLQDVDGDGIYTFATRRIPPGAYEAKVALDESWDVNYGGGGVQNGPNVPFVVVTTGTEVFFSWNSVTKVLTVSVEGAPGGMFEFTGFFAPVANPPAMNSVNAGRAIPVKFILNGDQGLAIFDQGYPSSRQVGCDAAAPIGGLEETVTAGSSSVAYDPDAAQYVYVWKTVKAWAGTCRQLIVRFNDGSEHRALFNFRR